MIREVTGWRFNDWEDDRANMRRRLEWLRTKHVSAQLLRKLLHSARSYEQANIEQAAFDAMKAHGFVGPMADRDTTQQILETAAVNIETTLPCDTYWGPIVYVGAPPRLCDLPARDVAIGLTLADLATQWHPEGERNTTRMRQPELRPDLPWPAIYEFACIAARKRPSDDQNISMSVSAKEKAIGRDPAEGFSHKVQKLASHFDRQIRRPPHR